MTININGNTADITLESEKTIGDVLAGLENWLRGSGHRLSGLEVDGEIADTRSIEGFFGRELASIEKLDIRTSSWAELAAEALQDILQYIDEYTGADFEIRSRLKTGWEKSPGAQFLQEQIPDMHDFVTKTFSGLGLNPPELRTLTEERLRELENPRQELTNARSLVEGAAKRLEDLPLDIQTGKDGRAAETVQIFSRLAEKLFRLYTLLKIEGFFPETLSVDELPIYTYIEEFGSALKELLAAYEARDAVLVGDLAEYELAPRLLRFYSAIATDPGDPVVS
jgi:hypothetical protein